MKYVIGVDIGTQGTKSGLFDENGVCLADRYAPLELIHPTPDATVQDPEEILDSVVSTVRYCIESSGVDARDVLAVSIAGQMAGIMGIGADGLNATPYDSWLDTRCDPQIAFMKSRGARKVPAITGGQITYAHGPKMLWWKDNEPEIWGKISKFTSIGSYCAMRMCGIKGEDAFIDYTYLHFTGFADTLNMKWSEELIELFGMDGKKLPKIVKPFDKVGEVTEEFAKRTGLKAGTAVAAGCGDSAASALGAGITKKGMMYDVAGTASIFSACTDVFAPDSEEHTILYARSVIEGLWTPLAYISGGGLCISWFKNKFYAGVPEAYKKLDAMAAETAPGSGGLYFVPHFAGRTCPNDPKVRGAWIGLDWTHGIPECYRAIMESIGYEYSIYKRIICENTGLEPIAVYGAGGGAGSRVFNKIKADILGSEYIPMECGDTGIAGSGLIAGLIAGFFKDDREMGAAAYDRVRKAGSVAYDPEVFEGYKGRVKEYENILKEFSNG